MSGYINVSNSFNNNLPLYSGAMGVLYGGAGGVSVGGAYPTIGGVGTAYGVGSGSFTVMNTNSLNLPLIQKLQDGMPKKNEYKLCDALYPFDLDMSSVHVIFHLLTWKYSEHPEDNIWNIIDCFYDDRTISICGKLMFKSKLERHNFANWWRSYTAKFFNNNSATEHFLPHLQEGKIQGTFIKNENVNIDSNYQTSYNSHSVNGYSSGLFDILPAWSWIARNCRKPVFRYFGGWVFSGENDAVNFKLFSPHIKTG